MPKYDIEYGYDNFKASAVVNGPEGMRTFHRFTERRTLGDVPLRGLSDYARHMELFDFYPLNTLRAGSSLYDDSYMTQEVLDARKLAELNKVVDTKLGALNDARDGKRIDSDDIKEGKSYIIRGRELDGFTMPEREFSIVKKLGDPIRAFVCKQVGGPLMNIRWTMSRLDCSTYGIEYQPNLIVMGFGTRFTSSITPYVEAYNKAVEKRDEFQKCLCDRANTANQISAKASSILYLRDYPTDNNGSITRLILYIPGFKDAGTGLVKCPTGTVLTYSQLQNSLRIYVRESSSPSGRGTRPVDFKFTHLEVRDGIINYKSWKYGNIKICEQGGFVVEIINPDIPSVLYRTSLEDLFTVSWDEAFSSDFDSSTRMKWK
jgi:hypothetical protein